MTYPSVSQITKFPLSLTLLYSHCSNTIDISVVVMLELSFHSPLVYDR